MTDFYKGKIINVKDLKTITYNLDIVEERASKETKKILFYIDNLAKKKTDVKNNNIDNMIIDRIKPGSVNEPGMEVIYQKVYDDKGNVYAKELITGALFPIKNEYSSFTVNYRNGDIRFIYYDQEYGDVFSIKEIMSGNDYCFIGNDLLKVNALPNELLKNMRFMAPEDERTFYLDGRKYRLIFYLPYSYCVEAKPCMTSNDDKDITYTITNEEKANELEVRKYTKEFENGLGKNYRTKEFCKMIKKLILCNDLGNYSIIDSHVESEKNSLVKKLKES